MPKLKNECDHLMDDENAKIEINCGDLKGRLHWNRFVCPGIHEPCIETDKEPQLISPKSFTLLANKGSRKDWKVSIKIERFTLRLLMEREKLDFFNHARQCSSRCYSRIRLPPSESSDETSEPNAQWEPWSMLPNFGPSTFGDLFETAMPQEQNTEFSQFWEQKNISRLTTSSPMFSPSVFPQTGAVGAVGAEKRTNGTTAPQISKPIAPKEIPNSFIVEILKHFVARRNGLPRSDLALREITSPQIEKTVPDSTGSSEAQDLETDQVPTTSTDERSENVSPTSPDNSPNVLPG